MHWLLSTEPTKKKKLRYTLLKKVASKAYERLHQKLDTKEGERGVSKLARARVKRSRESAIIMCIKDEDDKVLVDEERIKERW